MLRYLFFILLITLISCQPTNKYELDKDILTALGKKHRVAYEDLAEEYKERIIRDSTDTEAMYGLAEAEIILYIFGFTSRDETIPIARKALHEAGKYDTTSSSFFTISGMISLLDWDWENSKVFFEKAIAVDSANLGARHWLSLYYSAMGDFDSAMEQSDIITPMDTADNFRIGRGSLYYFAQRNEELKQLMLEEVNERPDIAWGYDWLGMAYCELKDFESSIETYFKAFKLADGTVEVGGGLGHALGLGGEYKLAKQMADYYTVAAKTNYLPPVQRSFIHIGIEEYDEALTLLEQAYEENSWFLVFIQIEPWYDPIKDNPRFQALIDKMNFPEK